MKIMLNVLKWYTERSEDNAERFEVDNTERYEEKVERFEVF
jgi:hypothetical protein